MAVYGSEGNVLVLWVPQSPNGITAPAAPTTTELGHASVVNVSAFVTRDGVQRPEGGNSIDTASIVNTHDTTAPGTTSGVPTLRCLLQTQDGTEDNLAWETFGDARGTVGSLVVRDGLPWETAIANGQEVEVYHNVILDTAQKSAPATNTPSTFSVQMHTQSDPVRRAVVGGGS